MASQYGITESDIHPDRVADAVYEALVSDPASGGVVVDIADVIEKAEKEFNSWLGGMFSDSDNIALAKPHVVSMVVYRLHARRAANGDYEIPEQAEADWKAAIDWAKSVGRELLAREGDVQPPGTGAVEYDSPDAKFGMNQLDYL